MTTSESSIAVILTTCLASVSARADYPTYIHVVREGETLASIAQVYYGDPRREAVLVAEVTSSEILAELPGLANEELAGHLTELGRNGNHFRGVHPRQLIAALRADPSIRPLIAAAAPLMPWRWRLHDQTYLVGAIGFRLAPR